MKRLLTYIIIVLVLSACTTKADHARMRSGLDSINVLNHNGQPFTIADVQPYVQFFDDHGTANDRLLAHYLLGRAYHEAGEAPMALECYQHALDCADTTAADCDYAQISRVYGQMAEIFYYQNLFRQQLEHLKMASKYAWKGQDTLAALTSYEVEYLAYNMLRLTDSAVFVIEDVARKYTQYGYSSDAAISLGAIVRTLIDNGNLPKAKSYMDIYESRSGLFNSRGDIEEGREIYYKSKGLYYLYTNHLDSAKYYFYKELRDGKDFNNQNAAALGLTLLYQRQHLADSAAKYAVYAYAMNDSMHLHRATNIIERMQSMYDYSRHQEIARMESERASAEKAKWQFSILLLLLVASVGGLIIYKMYVEKKKRMSLYLQNLDQLEQAQSELLQLRMHAEDYEELIAEKERIIKEQSIEMQERRSRILHDHSAIELCIKESAIYHTITTRKKDIKLSPADLRECHKLVIENLPNLNSLLLAKQHKLNKTDFYVCILFRLGFKSKETSNLLGISQARVSQICAKMLQTLFGINKGGAQDLTDLLQELY